MSGHKNAVLEMHWTPDGDHLITCSPDKTVRAWDAESGQQIKKMAEHSSYVNACAPAPRGPPLVVSGSDDGTAKLWDLRVKGAIQTYPDKFQVTSVAFSADADKIYTGGIDNELKVWDLRKGAESGALMALKGHTDTITGMAVSPDGTHLLTNSMDCTLRVWDMRPYVTGDTRCVKLFTGHQHNFEKTLLKCAWSADGSKVSAGSSCHSVLVWDFASRRVLYKLPGHKGTVNEVAFHPKEPIIGSAGSDKQIFLGELED